MNVYTPKLTKRPGSDIGAIRLEYVRLSFPELFEPVRMGEGKARYNANFLVPKDTQAATDLWSVISEVAAAQWKEKSAATLDAQYRKEDCCFRDGDLRDYDGYAGHYSITANAAETARPLVVDQFGNPLAAKDGKIYAGCYVHAILSIWAQDDKNGKRVNCSLKGVMFAAHGDAFSGATPAKPDDFADLITNDSGPATGLPPAFAAPGSNSYL